MSYNLHYTLPFKTLAGIDCHFDILENDYVGSEITLKGAGRSPVVHSWDASDILDPIQGSKCEVAIVAERGGISVVDFLTDDEFRFRGDFYYNGELYFTGYMMIEDFTQSYNYAPNELRLVFTDGLATLKNLKMNDLFYAYPVEGGYADLTSVKGIIYYILVGTNLILPTNWYINLFPYTATNFIDRDTDPDIIATELISVDVKNYINTDFVYQDCEQILTELLKAMRCVVRQERGSWNVIRIPEYKRFNGDIPGGQNVIFTTVPVRPLETITVGGSGDLVPIERSQLLTYVRPVRRVNNNYPYIANLQLLNGAMLRVGDLISSSSTGGVTTSRYELEFWESQFFQPAEIRVEVDDATNSEIDRYLWMEWQPENPFGVNPKKAVKSNDILVNGGDKINLTFSWRAETTNDDPKGMYYAIRLLSLDGLRLYVLDTFGSPMKFTWAQTVLDDYSPINAAYGIPDDFDITEWQTEDLMSHDINDLGMDRIPEDGILTITFFGANNDVLNFADLNTYIKDVRLEYFFKINDSTLITGQQHATDSGLNYKNDAGSQFDIDSASRFVSRGALFCDNGTSLVLADAFRKDSTTTDNYKFGEINTIDEALLFSSWRTIFEGDFAGICNMSDYATIEGLDGNFSLYKLSLDYRQNRCRATFFEVSKDSDPAFDDIAYSFKYLYSKDDE